MYEIYPAIEGETCPDCGVVINWHSCAKHETRWLMCDMFCRQTFCGCVDCECEHLKELGKKYREKNG